MGKQPFYDKLGNFKYLDTDKAYVRQRVYIVIKSGDKVVCQYDRISGLYSFPTDDDVSLDVAPTTDFFITSYILENNTAIKEIQFYSVYVVEDANLNDIPLKWCSVKDILVNKIQLDGTQKSGFKNILVRVKDNA
ncbi:MAG: hypothetical protein J6N49_04785 [Alphaproteobacteria bacterium]|nr:hypothetical protein [Alphaproteobacteria bacterium]